MHLTYQYVPDYGKTPNSRFKCLFLLVKFYRRKPGYWAIDIFMEGQFAVTSDFRKICVHGAYQ